MRAARSWKDRLPSILATLAVQTAIALLLLFSLGVVRQAISPVQTILLFPKPRREPVVIDARQPPKPQAAEGPAIAAPPAAPAQLPAYALPSQGLANGRPQAPALLQGLVTSFRNCRKREGEGGAPCPSAITPPDPRIVKLEDKRVRDADIWQAEIDRRNAPFALPGAGAGPLGVLITALANPSAFSDPRAYSYNAPSERRSGADQLARRRYHNPQTPLGGPSFENQVRAAGAAALGRE